VVHLRLLVGAVVSRCVESINQVWLRTAAVLSVLLDVLCELESVVLHDICEDMQGCTLDFVELLVVAVQLVVEADHADVLGESLGDDVVEAEFISLGVVRPRSVVHLLEFVHLVVIFADEVGPLTFVYLSVGVWLTMLGGLAWRRHH
jgi:hypothetical protein